QVTRKVIQHCVKSRTWHDIHIFRTQNVSSTFVGECNEFCPRARDNAKLIAKPADTCLKSDDSSRLKALGIHQVRELDTQVAKCIAGIVSSPRAIATKASNEVMANTTMPHPCCVAYRDNGV